MHGSGRMHANQEWGGASDVRATQRIADEAGTHSKRCAKVNDSNNSNCLCVCLCPLSVSVVRVCVRCLYTSTTAIVDIVVTTAKVTVEDTGTNEGRHTGYIFSSTSGMPPASSSDTFNVSGRRMEGCFDTMTSNSGKSILPSPLMSASRNVPVPPPFPNCAHTGCVAGECCRDTFMCVSCTNPCTCPATCQCDEHCSPITCK
jgi:hypothetical protein